VFIVLLTGLSMVTAIVGLLAVMYTAVNGRPVEIGMKLNIMHTQRMTLTGLLVAGALMAGCAVSTTQASTITTTGSGQNATPQATQPGTAPVAPTALPTRVTATTSSVAADGALALASPLISAGFDTTSKVTAVNVMPGQTVKKGDVLATLDPVSLNTALQTAQASLTLLKAQIAKNLAPAMQTDIENAKATLNSAYAAYDELKSVPTASTVEQALRTWNQAKNSLYMTQLDRDKTCQIKPGSTTEEDVKKAMTDGECKRADLNVQSTELKERIAYQAYLDAQKPAADTDLIKSWASVVQAQSSLATLQNGVSDEQKAIYDLQVKQAQVTVDRAQRRLQQAKLISPCDCTVQDVSLSVGATSTNGAITLLDSSQITFQTTNLNERDVVNMKSGQIATIRLKAFTDPITGTVDAVLPMSSGTLSTIALYSVIIHIDSPMNDLRPGMTGEVDIH
jgi:multidrug efflux pump subunit AcrA (membrane-fusion protein)